MRKGVKTVHNDGSYEEFPKLPEKYNIASYIPLTPAEVSDATNNNYPVDWYSIK